MKLILGGYGVMGRVVEGLALERGHEIVGIFLHIQYIRI